MAVLTVNTTSRAGVDIAAGFAAAAGGGDSYPNSGYELAIFKNTSAAPITITFVVQQTLDGQAVTNKTMVIAATTGLMIVGPFPTGVYNDGNSRMNFTYSGVTNLSVMIVKPATT